MDYAYPYNFSPEEYRRFTNEAAEWINTHVCYQIQAETEATIIYAAYCKAVKKPISQRIFGSLLSQAYDRKRSGSGRIVYISAALKEPKKTASESRKEINRFVVRMWKGAAIEPAPGESVSATTLYESYLQRYDKKYHVDRVTFGKVLRQEGLQCKRTAKGIIYLDIRLL